MNAALKINRVNSPSMTFFMALFCLFFLASCSMKKTKRLQTENYKGAQIFSNQLVVQTSDVDALKDFLKLKNIQADLSPIFDNYYHIKTDYIHMASAITDISQLPGVQVEPNYAMELNSTSNSTPTWPTPKVDASKSFKKYERKTWPNDPHFADQWYANNVGQEPQGSVAGFESADIGMLEAWQMLKDENIQPDKPVVVAVIDTGIDYNHPDLKNNLWINEAELEPIEGLDTNRSGIAGKDDDGNGYIDDVYGYDFFPIQSTNKPHGQHLGSANPIDRLGHGTHVSGIIAAEAGNNEGIAGINPTAKIMALQVFSEIGKNITDSVAISRAIIYAVENGADIISMSLGGPVESYVNVEALKKANEAGIVVIVAAGNDSKNIDLEPTYPAATDLPNIITVGSSTSKDNPSSFSNYGRTVDIFAPGSHIISTIPDGQYAFFYGTSMAAPVVSGAASLLMTKYPELKRNPEELKHILIGSADFKESYFGYSDSAGRLNVARALRKDIQGSFLELEEKSIAYNYTFPSLNEELVDIRHPIYVEGAKAISFQIKGLQKLKSVDNIYVYDKNYRLKTVINRASLGNSISRDAAYQSPLIYGDKVYIRFTNSLIRDGISKSFFAGTPADTRLPIQKLPSTDTFASYMSKDINITGVKALFGKGPSNSKSDQEALRPITDVYKKFGIYESVGDSNE